MPNPSPCYNLADFVKACGNQKAVYVWGCAIQDAKNELNLLSVKSILSFIEAGGLESPALANSAPLKKQPHITVDSYNFYSGTLYCYLAFYQHPQTMIWNIKSLKRNTNASPRPFVLATALRNAGLLR